MSKDCFVVSDCDITGHIHLLYSITCLKQQLKMKTKNLFSRPIITQFRSKVLQNAPREHSAIISTCIKLSFVFKTFVLSIFEWPLKTGFTVYMFVNYFIHVFDS